MSPSFHRILVIVTACLVVSVLGFFYLQNQKQKQMPLAIDPTGQPFMGSDEAKVEVVLFEDFQCALCQKFNEEILPKLEADYVDRGTVRCYLVLLAFIEGSEPIANAALAVYRQTPDLFFPYTMAVFHYLKEHPLDEIDPSILLLIANQVGGIDLTSLKRAIQSNRYVEEIRRNFYWAEEIMGPHFGTPAIFVNGVRIPPMSYQALQNQINKAERQ